MTKETFTLRIEGTRCEVPKQHITIGFWQWIKKILGMTFSFTVKGVKVIGEPTKVEDCWEYKIELPK